VSGTLISLGGVDPNKLPANSLFLTLRREGQPAAVPDAWHWGTLDDSQIYLGHCYGRAFAWMLSQSDRARRRREPSPIAGAQLVHGTVVSPGERDPIGHAWVELADVVFDGVTQGFYTRESYYRLAAAQPLAKYSWTQARRLRKQHDHLGPWHEVIGAESAESSARA
jgi:hypothetical protein